MNYLLRDKDRKHGRKLFLRIAGVCVFLAIVAFLFSSPLSAFLHGIQHSVAYVFGYYDDSVRPIAENAYTKSLEDDNAQLKELLGRAPEKDDRELATIIARPPKTPYDSFVVDIGEDHGLMPGDFVYADMDYLVGQVDSVGQSSSVVKLFSSPDARVDVLISSSTTPVTAEGRGSGNFYIKVPKNIPVSEGDPIVVPDFHNTILGVAEKIEGGEGDAYSYIYFKLPVNVNSLRYVEIKKIVH